MAPNNNARSTASASAPSLPRTRGQSRNNPTSADKAAAEEAAKQARAQEARKKELAQAKAQEAARKSARNVEADRRAAAMVKEIEQGGKGKGKAKETGAKTTVKKVTFQQQLLQPVRKRWGPPSNVHGRVIEIQALAATAKKQKEHAAAAKKAQQQAEKQRAQERPERSSNAGPSSTVEPSSDEAAVDPYEDEIDQREEQAHMANQDALFLYGVTISLRQRGRGGIVRMPHAWEGRVRNEDWLPGDFDTSALGTVLFGHMDRLGFDEEVESYTAVISCAHTAARDQQRTLNDLSTKEWNDVVETELKTQWKTYQRQLDVKVIVIGTITPPATKRASEAVDSLTRSPSHRRTRTEQQVEASSESRDRNEAVGMYDERLCDKWRCLDSRCLNERKFCFVDFMSNEHYALKAIHTKNWATAIHYQQDGASLDRPPLALCRELKKKGPVDGAYKDPLGKEQRDEKKASGIDRIINMAEKAFELQVANNLMGTIGSNHQSIQHQQSHPPPQYPPHPYWSTYGYPMQSQQPSPSPVIPPQPPNVTPTRELPSQVVESIPPAPPSSPISTNRNEEEQIMEDFWDWKMRSTNNDERKRRFFIAKGIVESQEWRIHHLQKMNDTSSTLYRRAIELGLPDGLVTGFKEDFHHFKRVYQEEYLPARQLAGLGQGGFIPGDRIP